MYALIDSRFNNRVCEVKSQAFDVADPLLWVVCPDACDTSWSYDGLNFLPPPPLPVAAPLTGAQKLTLIKKQRNTILRECDWTQLGDAPSTIVRSAWATYRQALRDMPSDPTLNLDNPIWPIPPSNLPI